MSRRRLDDLAVASALVVVVLLCVIPKYLPMVDLPQHHAMVSIFAHHSDPAYGFHDRYTFDLLRRPYATVYLLGAGLTLLTSLRIAMAMVVALCTIAPIVGAYTLLRAMDRPRAWSLLAVPFAFGSLWHWGFLNFLLGTGLMLGGLALVVRQARTPTSAGAGWLAALGFLLLFTHVHGVFMLLLLAPLLTWGYLGAGQGWRGLLRTLVPLAPSAVATAVFVLATWAQATGDWPDRDPGLGERLRRFPEFLAMGIRDPWATVSVFALGSAVALLFLLRVGTAPSAPDRRELVARVACLGAQIALYLILPLNTGTATYVSARHALLIVIFALPLVPVMHGWRLHAGRVAVGAFALAGLVVAGRHVVSFDREARQFDPILAAMRWNTRVAPLIVDKGSSSTSPTTFPYLHFAAYHQAQRGGDLARSFAVVWNVPVRYRASYHRHVVDEAVEWDPQRFSLTEDLPHFDYLVVRRAAPPRFPAELGLRVVVSSGPWTLVENPHAVPVDRGSMR